MNVSRKVALSLLAADFALFAVFFVVALVSHSATIVVPVLALRWEFATAGLETIRWFPAAHLFAAMLSVASSSGETERLVVKVASPVVVVSAIIAAAALIFGPISESGIDSAKASSRRFSAYIEAARLDLDRERADAARVDLEVLRAISSKDVRLPPLERRLSALQAKVVRNDAKDKPPVPDPASARAALKRARDYYAKGDWYNAHWQATLSLRLDPSLVEAKRLAALAWEEIARATGSTPRDEAEARFFAEKFQGYGLLRSGDYIGAWRIFADLAKDHGADPEVKRYLRESLAGIDRTAFYRDEADQAFAQESIPRFFLRYKIPGGERVIAALDSGWTDGAGYFKDLEYLEIKSSGKATLIRAPWAKVAGGRLFLVAVDRESPGTAFRADARTIDENGKMARTESERAPASLELGLGAGELLLIAKAHSEPAGLSLTDAVSALAKTSDWGIAPEGLMIDILSRLAIPFSSFGTAIIGILIGLRFRPGPEGGIRGYSLSAIPFMAILTFGAWYGIFRLDELAAIWSAKAAPGIDAIWLSSGIRTVFIVAGVILVVGATRAESAAEVETDEAE